MYMAGGLALSTPPVVTATHVLYHQHICALCTLDAILYQTCLPASSTPSCSPGVSVTSPSNKELEPLLSVRRSGM